MVYGLLKQTRYFRSLIIRILFIGQSNSSLLLSNVQKLLIAILARTVVTISNIIMMHHV